MTVFEVAALLSAAGLVTYFAYLATAPETPRPGAWRLPALLCVAFLGWSLVAMAVEGVTGFWPVHTQTLWGNQVWFDLLLAVGIAWTFILPQARALGMRVIPWMVVTMGTGCIGLLALTARLLYLREHAEQGAAQAA